ncbi:hypothetical protein AL065_09780 [Pseudomonas amygdali pv. ulmi]|uniref:hypothetical protein n=1 Tax=Pseudomonas amygdali TaxID=47877 RepID=UPI00070A88A5|nr:hypothetical protein [Pseudomonas amygdali]KWS36829.1 hypothetical protein AL065_09780 [Pseudomonas amygdali pv. ulmi]
MFAEKFSPLINSFPQEAEALRRVASFVEDIETRKADRLKSVKLDPNRMFEIAKAGSVSRLARVVQILLDAHIFERRLLVKFPSGSGMMFKSYADLPEVVRDPDRDIDFEVTEDSVEPVYVLVTNGIS